MKLSSYSNWGVVIHLLQKNILLSTSRLQVSSQRPFFWWFPACAEELLIALVLSWITTSWGKKLSIRGSAIGFH